MCNSPNIILEAKVGREMDPLGGSGRAVEGEQECTRDEGGWGERRRAVLGGRQSVPGGARLHANSSDERMFPCGEPCPPWALQGSGSVLFTCE